MPKSNEFPNVGMRITHTYTSQEEEYKVSRAPLGDGDWDEYYETHEEYDPDEVLNMFGMENQTGLDSSSGRRRRLRK